jgi:mannose-1-phosphate guanylyltransferase
MACTAPSSSKWDARDFDFGGTAEVTIGETVQMLCENESVYIPLGELHRLANPGKILLELIEVQTGSYLGEDDIIRIVDEFGRN